MWFHITHARTRAFNGPLSGTTRVSRYKKYKTNLDFTEARDSEWQWNPLGHMQVCTLLQRDNHASTPPLSFLQARCPSCCPTNSVKALKATQWFHINKQKSNTAKTHAMQLPLPHLPKLLHLSLCQIPVWTASLTLKHCTDIFISEYRQCSCT